MVHTNTSMGFIAVRSLGMLARASLAPRDNICSSVLDSQDIFPLGKGVFVKLKTKLQRLVKKYEAHQVEQRWVASALW